MARVLVTGGAGYVGSHCARHLAALGHDVETLDSLAHGHEEAVTGRLWKVDLRDREAVGKVLEVGFDAVLHFAALMSVGDSVTDPLGYFDTNVAGTLNLLAAMREHGVRKLVFSSTCAVYGVPPVVPIAETTRFAPISPYGETKATVERVLDLACAAGQLDRVSLRYFNAAGASHDGHLGEAHDPETHLIPIALDAALTGRQLTIFGDAHPTRDGTCVRDYVHVEDLARAHAKALVQVLNGQSGVYNLGSGTGATVREVLDTIAEVTGRPVGRIIGPARRGDPPALISDTRHTAEALDWTTEHDLRRILQDAWAWHQHPRFGPGFGPGCR